MSAIEGSTIDDVIDDPDAANSKPEWKDMAVSQSIDTSGPNVGNLQYPAAIRHAEFLQSDRQDLADHYEFRETINAAIAMDAAYFASPEITQEEAVRRLMWARDKAELAVNRAKLIQKTADTVRDIDPVSHSPLSENPSPEPIIPVEGAEPVGSNVDEKAESADQTEEIDNQPKPEVEATKVDVEYLRGLGIYEIARGLEVLKTTGEWDSGWTVGHINSDERIIVMVKSDDPEGELRKRIPFDDAKEYIRAKSKNDQQTPEPEANQKMTIDYQQDDARKIADQQRRVQVPPPRQMGSGA